MNGRRKMRLIDTRVQGAIIRKIATHWFIFIGILFLAWPLWNCWITGELKSFPGLLMDGFRQIALVFLIILLASPFVLFDLLKLTNRFCGPIFRLHNTVRKIADGEEMEPVQLRQDDFWKEFAGDLNLMIERLKADQANYAEGDSSLVIKLPKEHRLSN